MTTSGDTAAELSVGSHFHPPPPSRVCDDCIVDGVRQALKASGYCHLAKLSALSQEGCVTLLGTVPSYYLKQVAQAVLEPVPGIRGINNRLVVVTRK